MTQLHKHAAFCSICYACDICIGTLWIHRTRGIARRALDNLELDEQQQ
jgi:hypothetical protein